MKAITLWQPWATLVAIGAKRTETRSWRTNHTPSLAIHSVKRFPVQAKEMMHNKYIEKALHGAGISIASELPLGSVLCVCEFVECVQITHENKPFLPELAFGDYTPGRWAWMLGDRQRFLLPIPARGSQGLWEWDFEYREVI